MAIKKLKGKDYYNHLYEEDTDGYFQAIQLLNGAVKKRENKKDQNVMELVELKGQKDWFLNINTMYIPYRAVENIRQFRSLYIDIDLKKGDFKISSAYEIFILANEGKIPKPSMIVDSGRGLHVYWRIENAPKQALGTWQQLQDLLYYELKHLGADGKALDAARVLRPAETINSKTGTETEIMYLDNSIKYSMKDLREQYLGYKPYEKDKIIKQEAMILKNQKRKKVVANAFFNSYSLHMERAEDLISLCNQRDYDIKGHRNMVIHCYAYWRGLIVRDDEMLLEDVKKLNKSFIEPLKSTEIKSICKSANKQVEKFIKYENELRLGLTKKKIAGKRDKVGYWYKNSTLIELLEITLEEQKHLKTIISKEEKYRRNNDKRTPKNENGLTKKQQELQDLKIKALELKKQGLNNTQIAKRLGFDRKKVSRLVNSL